MKYKRSLFSCAVFSSAFLLIQQATAAEVAQSMLNFTIAPNSFVSSTIKQGFDPAYANKQSDPIYADSLSVGLTSVVRATKSYATGDRALVDTGADGGIAIGFSALSSASGGMAIGANAIANSANGIALGAGSVTGTANSGWAGMSIGGTAMTNTLNANAVLSISGSGINRQIQGVADGAVTSTSTDAVNGSQLFQALQALQSQITNINVNPGGGAASVPIAADNVHNMAAPSVATGQNGLTVGYGATSTGENSVAIGNGSNDDGRSNVVSVGNSGQTRQITNVAAGTKATDAVNVSQLQPVVDALGGGTYIDQSTGAVIGPSYNVAGSTYNNVGSALDATNRRIDQLGDGLSRLSGTVERNQKESRSGIAAATALANLPFGTTPGKWSPAASFGSFQGKTAFAGGLQYNIDNSYRMKIRGTVSFVPGTNNTTFGGGVGMEF